MQSGSNGECELRGGINKDTVVYKYFPLKYLVDILQTKRMKLFHTVKWEEDGDVYENFLLNYLFEETYGGQESVLSLKNWKKAIYGQSWTLKKESDAMWRIYSGTAKSDVKNSNKLFDLAVKVRTTIAKLCDSVNGSLDLDTDNYTSCSACIGKVKYLGVKGLNKWVGRHTRLDGESITDSFFMKRYPFNHEKEVRIIVNSDNEFDPKETIELKISEDLFDEYVLDPRLSDCQYNSMKDRLMLLGVPENKIRKSTLYTFIPKTIKVKN